MLACKLAVLLLVLTCMVIDIKYYRIPNIFTMPIIMTGLAYNLVNLGIEGFKRSFLGILVPFIVLIVFNSLKMLGAGDIKLLCAIGSVMGYEFITWVMIYTFLCGGIIAFFLMLYRKNLLIRLYNILIYIKTCFLSLKLISYQNFNDMDPKARFPFAIAIAVGTIVSMIRGPL